MDTRQKIVKPNNLYVFGRKNTKGLNKVAKIGYGHLSLREENFTFNDNL